MNPEQYQVCVNGAKDYEAKIIQITNIIGEAQAARQDGKNEVADQKVKEARIAAAESSSIVKKIASRGPAGALDATTGKVLDIQGKVLDIVGLGADTAQ
jgi:hypothetical protein